MKGLIGLNSNKSMQEHRHLEIYLYLLYMVNLEGIYQYQENKCNLIVNQLQPEFIFTVQPESIQCSKLD